MNTSELTNKALVLRRLADQFDNIALRQISLDNESAGLLAEFRELIPSRSYSAEPPRFEQEAPLNKPAKPAKAGHSRKPRINLNTNRVAAAVIRILGSAPLSLHRDELLKRLNVSENMNMLAPAFSQYTSSLKRMGLITNPQRGYWRIAA